MSLNSLGSIWHSGTLQTDSLSQRADQRFLFFFFFFIFFLFLVLVMVVMNWAGWILKPMNDFFAII